MGPAPYGPPPQQKKGGSGCLIAGIIGGALAVILLIVGGVGAYFYFSGGGSDSDGSGGSQGTGAAGDTAFDGRWSGLLTQYDESGAPVSDWSMHLEIEGGEVVDAYEDGLDSGDGMCTWDSTPAAVSGSAMTFTYTVTGDTDCVDNGSVVLSDDAGIMTAEVTSVFSDGTLSVSSGTMSPS